MTNNSEFADLLEEHLQKSSLTLGRLSKRAGVPKTTIINWRDGVVAQPRHWQDLAKVAVALELSEKACDALLATTNYPPVAALFQMDLVNEDAELLGYWRREEAPNTSTNTDELFPVIPEPGSKELSTALQEMPPVSANHIPRSQLEQQTLQAFEGSSVLVLWGMGGSGKTSLTIWLANTTGTQFPDGIFWWQSISESSVSEIHLWVAKRLGISLDEAQQDQWASELRGVLRQRKCLIVLDDLPSMLGVDGLNLGSENSRIVATTRDRRIADRLEASLIHVTGLTVSEGLELLGKWSGKKIEGDRLIKQLEGLPLAIRLCGAQIRDGMPYEILMSLLVEENRKLDLLESNLPRIRTDSVRLTFDISYNQLSERCKIHFASLGYIVRRDFDLDMLQQVWGLSAYDAWRVIQEMGRYAILEKVGHRFWLHSLLHEYARERWKETSDSHDPIPERHAVWHIRHVLCHPKLLDDDAPKISDIDNYWRDIVTGVRWATQHDPQLAAQAIVLAFSERAALAEVVGQPLIAAVQSYAEQCDDVCEQAILYECIGELCLLQSNLVGGIEYFEKAIQRWISIDNEFAVALCHLRIAGARLLAREYQLAVQEAHRAQTCLLSASYPPIEVTNASLDQIYYWFDVFYKALTRWDGLKEANVIALVEQSRELNQPLLQARALSIYRSWAIHNQTSYDKIREIALQAYRLWRKCSRMDRADDEISFTKYWLTNRYSQQTAKRFAKRRSQTTPNVHWINHKLGGSNAVKWWLQAEEEVRISWLSRMLPRYLAADDRPNHPKLPRLLSILRPGHAGYTWVEDILSISMLGDNNRRLHAGIKQPTGHLLTGPEWNVFSGRRPLVPARYKEQELIRRYMHLLDNRLNLKSQRPPAKPVA